MSRLLKQICAAESRLIELRMRLTMPDSYHDPRDIREMIDLEDRLHDTLWPRRRAELAGASEAARRVADLMMRGQGQALRGFTRDLIAREVGT